MAILTNFWPLPPSQLPTLFMEGPLYRFCLMTGSSRASNMHYRLMFFILFVLTFVPTYTQEIPVNSLWGKNCSVLIYHNTGICFSFFFLPRKDWKDNSKRGWDRGKENFRFFFLLSHRFLISVTTLLFGSSTIPTFIHRTIFCVPKKLHCVYFRILKQNNILIFFHKT